MFLSASQVREFKDNGVLIAKNVLTEADFAAVEAETAAYVDRRARELQAAGKLKDLHENAPFDKRIGLLFEQCPEIEHGIDIMHLRGRAMFAFLHNKNLLDAVESLIGPELTCSPIQHLRARMPGGKDGGKHGLVPWHQDAGVTLEEADASDIVTCWLPLIHATKETGCMEVIPGAHKLGHLEHVAEGGTTIRPDLLPKTEPLCAECPRGGVVFMTKYTPHRGQPNLSNLVRWTIDLRYQRTGTPTGRPFHPDFPVRSKADPASVTQDYESWCERWMDALSNSKGKQMHRVKPKPAMAM